MVEHHKDNVTSLTHLGKTLVKGKTTACFLRSVQNMQIKLTSSMAIHAGSYSTQMALHSILWPTVFFIAGFVGMFFSLIYVCRDLEMDFSDMDFCIYVTGVVDVVV